MKAGNIISGVRDHRADFPDPAALGQSPHASHACRASSVDAHGVIRLLRCVPRVPCKKLHLRLAAAPAWLDGSGSTDQARRIKLNGGTPARPGGCRAKGHQHFLKGGAPAHPGRLLRGDRRHSRKHSSALEEATGARQRATAGTPEELYRPSGMPAAFRSPAACTQSAASSASLASTTRLRRAIGPYLVPKYALARIQTRAHMAPCPRLHAPHASVCPAP